MKTRLTLFIASILISNLSAICQVYTAVGFANGVAGEKYKMPGTVISNQSLLELDVPGVVTGYNFDIASIAGPNFKADSGLVFGIYTQGNATDAGGMDKRGYDTKSNATTASRYTPIRWNGGSQLWRQGGQWVRYTIDFDEASYNFVFRSNVNSFALSSQKFTIKIFDPKDMSKILFTKDIDLSTMPAVGAVSNNVLRIGGGATETNWFKLLDNIDLPQGSYVVELSSPAISYTFSSWGVFTFNKAIEVYSGKPYTATAFDALADTVSVFQYDKVGGAMSFASDSGVTVGVYNNVDVAKGENIRSYLDNPTWNVANFNSIAKTMQSNGAWYNFTVKFEGNSPYYFVFKGVANNANLLKNSSVKITDPSTKNLMATFNLENDIKYLSDADENDELRWMYTALPKTISTGTYVVTLDLPQIDTLGAISRFIFFNENPISKMAHVNMFNWPTTVAADNNLHSELYSVKVYQNGKLYDMFMHKSIPDTRASKYPDDKGGNGVMTELYDRTFNFCQFEFNDEITVEATKIYGTTASRVEIQPKAYGINPFYFDGRTVKFKLKHQPNRPNYISINFVANDNLDAQPLGGQAAVKHGLVLFADKPEVYKPDTTAAGTVFYSDQTDSATIVNANLIYFRPGDWDLKKVFKRGVIDLTKNNQKIYLEGGAYVRGSIWSHGKSGIWLYGRGIVSGWDMLFHELLDETGNKEAFLSFYDSDDCHIEGITIIDPTHHSIPTRSRSYFKNVKIIGWSYNQDGTRVGSGSYIEEMFTKTQDDRSYADRNHVYKNSVEWPMRNGAFGILGWGSYDGGSATYDNIYFVNSEWERPESSVGNQAVIGSNIKQGSNQKNDTIRNLYLEDYTTLLCILRISYDATSGDAWNPSDPGEIKDFLFENIKVEQPFITTNGTKKYNRIEGFVKNGIKATVHDITFRNLIVAGELVLDYNKSKYFYIDPATTYNIKFEAVGKVHTMRATANAGGSIFPKGDIAVPNGTNQTVTIEPNAGYKIKDVIVDYQSVGPLPTVSLTNVTSDHKIEVIFEAGTNSFELTSIVDPNTVLTDTINFGVDHLHDNVAVEQYVLNNQKLKLFPNPASTKLWIVKSNPHSEVILYNKLGQLVLRTTNQVVDVTSLPTDVYIVNCENKYSKVSILNR